jgi:hypothetical protein
MPEEVRKTFCQYPQAELNAVSELAWDLREEYRSKRKTGRKRAATTTTTTTIDDAAEQPTKKAKILGGASQKIRDEVVAEKVEEETIKAELAKI